VEVKAGASELRGKESRIGVGDLPDRVETNCLKARLGFRPDAPKAGYGKRSKPRFGVVRRNEGQAIRLLAGARDLGHVLGGRQADRYGQAAGRLVDRFLQSASDGPWLTKELLGAGHVEECLIKA
jgi:hypothetical protein